MPTYQEGESKEEWLKRCIPILINEGKDKDQAVAICNSMYEQNKKGKSAMKNETRENIPRSKNYSIIAGIDTIEEELNPEALPDELRSIHRKPISEQNKDAFPID